MCNILRLIKSKEHTCPWWICFTFDNPLRKLIHDPVKMLSPYVKKGDRVLDLGPGMGHFTIPLCAMVGDEGVVYAADIQRKMLEGIERKAKRKNIRNLKTILIEENSFETDTDFDVILAFWMMHEVDDKELMLKGLRDKLKEDGKLLIAEPKIHISEKRFEDEIDLVKKAGFRMTTGPAISLSRAALFMKTK